MHLIRIIITILGVLLGTSLWAQGGQPTTGGSDVPPSLLPSTQLPTLQNRLNQLPQTGNGGTDPNGDPILNVNPNAVNSGNSPSATGSSRFPQPLMPGQEPNPTIGVDPENSELLGENQVLDDEDSDFENKPTDITEVNLNPDLTTNVFGHQLFEEGAAAFALEGITVVPDDYIIGPGDVFSITIFGREELYESHTVAPDGSFLRPLLGKIYVGGMTYGEAKEVIRRRFRRVISDRSSVEIRLTGDRRSVSISIVGEVRRQGNYRINSGVPAFNALFAAGGVNKIGSVRNIQLVREGKVVEVIDLYEYLIEGNTNPIFLKNNDVLFVPPQGRVVDITGAIKKPMAYELQEGENLKALLRYAGGLNFDAMKNKAQVARLENEREVLINFPLQEVLIDARKDYNLETGDRVIINRVNMGAFNIVQVYGDVEYPNTYQLHPGDRITDVINRAGGLGIAAYLQRAYVVRVVPGTSELIYLAVDLSKIYGVNGDSLMEDNQENLELQYFDMLMIFSQTQLQEERSISVEGEVRLPGTFRTFPTMTVKDLLYLVGGPKEDADLNNLELSIFTRAENYYIPREEDGVTGARTGGTDSDDAPDSDVEAAGAPVSTDQPVQLGIIDRPEVVRRIRVGKDWENNPALDTMRIYGFDRLKVYSKYDFLSIRYLEVDGAVRKPGLYQLQRGMTLKDVFYLSGGLTDSADINEIELYQDISLSERGNFNTRTDRQEIVRIQIEGKDWQTSTIADTIEMDQIYKVIIRSGVNFFQQGYVEIKGLVNSPGIYKVSPNMTAKDLLYMADGLQMQADFDHIELSRVVETLSGSGEVIPIPIVISSIAVDQNWQEDTLLDKIQVNAFDQMIVRKNPAFNLQESVFIEGEVLIPGEYHKSTKIERLSSIVSRAGGITEIAYLEGATIRRPDVGEIAIKLDKALRRPNSKFNISLLEGDTLFIPSRVDVVTVTGNVMRPDVKVLFEPKKRKFRYYLQLAGGYDRRSKKRLSTVTYVDGTVKSVRRFLFFRRYPKIEQGAVIYVPVKPERPERKSIREFNPQQLIASLSSILTFYLLIDRTFSN